MAAGTKGRKRPFLTGSQAGRSVKSVEAQTGSKLAGNPKAVAKIRALRAYARYARKSGNTAGANAIREKYKQAVRANRTTKLAGANAAITGALGQSSASRNQPGNYSVGSKAKARGLAAPARKLNRRKYGRV